MYKIEIESDVELDYNASEAFKALRTNINFCGKDVSVVAITSCTPNEGKSITTYELAKTFASTGKKVLYVDADMRKSVFKSRFGVAAKGDGLSHYLSGLADIDDVTGEISFQNETHQYDELEAGSYKMHAIIAGAVPPNPSELLESDRFKEFIAYAKENYDYVFVEDLNMQSISQCLKLGKSGIYFFNASLLVQSASTIKSANTKAQNPAFLLFSCLSNSLSSSSKSRRSIIIPPSVFKAPFIKSIKLYHIVL